MILGEERIVTNRSGRFRWPDSSAAAVYVYDADAELVVRPLVAEVDVDGERFTELRMPSDHLAILVRRR